MGRSVFVRFACECLSWFVVGESGRTSRRRPHSTRRWLLKALGPLAHGSLRSPFATGVSLRSASLSRSLSDISSLRSDRGRSDDRTSATGPRPFNPPGEQALLCPASLRSAGHQEQHRTAPRPWPKPSGSTRRAPGTAPYSTATAGHTPPHPIALLASLRCSSLARCCRATRRATARATAVITTHKNRTLGARVCLTVRARQSPPAR